MNCLRYVCKGVSKHLRWQAEWKKSVINIGGHQPISWASMKNIWRVFLLCLWAQSLGFRLTVVCLMPAFPLPPLMGLQRQSERHWTVSLENGWLLGWHWGVERRKCDNATAVRFKKPYILSKIIFLIIKPVTWKKFREGCFSITTTFCLVGWGL